MTDFTTEGIFEAIHAVMHAIRTEQYRALRGAPDHLTHLEGKMLGFCARHPGASLRELVVHFGRDKGQLARLIKTLKKHGLLTATTDPEDRRSLKLHLTPRGKAIHQALQRRLRHLTQIAGREVSAAERSELVRLLAKLRANLETGSAAAREPGVAKKTG